MTDNKSSTIKTGIPTNVLPLSATPSESVRTAAIDAGIHPEALEQENQHNPYFIKCGENSTFTKNPSFEKNLKETKKVMDNFREKVATYPKYISHEGSTVLCVLLSMEPNPSIRMEGLPVSDGNILRQSIPENLLEADFDDIRVEFDEQKDFIVTFLEKDVVIHTIRLFNTVIHPQNIHVPTSVVDVEDGDKISIGGKVVMDKNAVKKLIGFKPELPSTKKEEEKEEPRRQQVTGRNAFEIRTDIMQMALDWATKNGKPNMTPDEVVNIAKKFYTFVENKRY